MAIDFRLRWIFAVEFQFSKNHNENEIGLCTGPAIPGFLYHTLGTDTNHHQHQPGSGHCPKFGFFKPFN
jgi:hypothetical protein